MAQDTINAEDLLRDIYDEEPAEIQEYVEWASWCEIYEDRRLRYEQAIEQQLKAISPPVSLDALHINKLEVSA